MGLATNVNYLSVLLAAVASFVFGWIWYGPLFGKTWAGLMGFSKKEMNNMKKKPMAGTMATHFIGTLITAYVLAVLIGALNIVTIGSALNIAFWAWLGFFASATLLGAVLWDTKPVNLYWLNAAYWLINLGLMSLVVVSL